MKKISLIVAVYNGEKTIWRCVESLLAQTLPDCEIIVVDDGSTDGTHKLLEGFKDKFPRLRLITCAENRGQRAAQYLGYLAATGEYVSAVDADDYVGPSRFESLCELSVHAPIVVSAMTRVETDGHTHPMAKDLRTGLVPVEEFFPVLYGEPTDKLFPRELVLAGCERYCLFHGDNAWRQSANMPLFWAMLKAGRIIHTGQADYYYTNSPDSNSKTITLERADQELSNVLRRYVFLSHEFPEYRQTIARKFRNFLDHNIWTKISMLLGPDTRQSLEGRYQYIKKTLDAAA